MDFKTLVFYFFAAVLIFAALRVITSRNPVHSVLHLVLAFFSAGCIWALLEAEFLAIAIILIYIGAVMVLFLFVVMMLDISVDKLRQMFWRYLPLGVLIGLLLAFEMGLVLLSQPLQIADASLASSGADYSNTKALGQLLFTDYVYPFELASVILLVGIIAAVVLTLRDRQSSKAGRPHEQIAVKASERLRVVKMPVEQDDRIDIDPDDKSESDKI